MDPKDFAKQIQTQREFFERSTRCLTEEHSAYAPVEGMMTVAQQVAHVAHTIDWFREGAFRPEGFDMNFEEHAKAILAVTSLTKARELLKKSTDTMADFLASKTAEELFAPLPPGPIMGGAPRLVIVSALDDHTAHHRGALSVYSRLLGLTPAMPYMDM